MNTKGIYRRTVGVCIAILGLLLVAGAVGLTVWNIRTDVDAGEVNEEVLDRVILAIQESREERQDDLVTEEESDTVFIPGLFTPEDLLPDEKKSTEMKTATVEGREYVGVLSIPILGLELSVMKNCDDQTIKNAPGRWCGNPHRNGFVIGGHNYRSHLGKIDRLREGDQVIFTDMKGKIFEYKVIGQEILDADQGKLLRDKEWALSLFTCTLAGNRRIVVRCLKAES